MAASERVGHSVNFSSAVLYATATRAPRPPWSLPTSSKSVAVNYVSLFDFVNVTGGGRSVRFLRPPPSLPRSVLYIMHAMQMQGGSLLARSRTPSLDIHMQDYCSSNCNTPLYLWWLGKGISQASSFSVVSVSRLTVA